MTFMTFLSWSDRLLKNVKKIRTCFGLLWLLSTNDSIFNVILKKNIKNSLALQNTRLGVTVQL